MCWSTTWRKHWRLRMSRSLLRPRNSSWGRWNRLRGTSLGLFTAMLHLIQWAQLGGWQGKGQVVRLALFSRHSGGKVGGPAFQQWPHSWLSESTSCTPCQQSCRSGIWPTTCPESSARAAQWEISSLRKAKTSEFVWIYIILYVCQLFDIMSIQIESITINL